MEGRVGGASGTGAWLPAQRGRGLAIPYLLISALALRWFAASLLRCLSRKALIFGSQVTLDCSSSAVLDPGNHPLIWS
ncbi:hypothetical protein PDJAM_G00082220 [Pangasius djambal]|uniref:Uncharacterized protein n=1 Tax=Pangasius djambal TaxID=1691987 RepID=A0ACC5Z443_9TELE|nr:hypothetical protein [Pangasius djambal]